MGNHWKFSFFSSPANNKIKTALYVDDSDHLIQNMKGKNSKPGNQNLGKKMIITNNWELGTTVQGDLHEFSVNLLKQVLLCHFIEKFAQCHTKNSNLEGVIPELMYLLTIHQTCETESQDSRKRNQWLASACGNGEEVTVGNSPSYLVFPPCGHFILR